MADEIETAIQTAAKAIAGYVANVSTLQVTTEYVQPGPGGDVSFESAKPIARTIIQFDGDCETIVPITTPAGAPMQVNTALFDLHERNVTTATEYRARVLGALVGALQGWIEALRHP